jgi:hypothetical protein
VVDDSQGRIANGLKGDGSKNVRLMSSLWNREQEIVEKYLSFFVLYSTLVLSCLAVCSADFLYSLRYIPMNSSTPLIDRFQQLTTNHTTQFEPQITHIRQRLDAELALLQQQETALVQAQDQALQELRQAIHTDARFLLSTAQFQAFVESVVPKERSRYSSRPDIQVTNQVADWSLCQSTKAIGISNYQEDIDHDGYDDERTFTLYSYGVDVRWGDREIEISEIQTNRAYGVAEQSVHDDEDQLEELSDRLNEFYDWDKQTAEEKMLMLEMSYLVYYCCTLLKLQPQKVQLVYDSTVIAE